MDSRHFFALLLMAALRTTSNGTQASDRPPETGGTPPSRPVVVELFTSQGCSSCPPADKLLSKLGEQGAKVIPLEFHVDFWNHQGWSDPFSKADWTQRQVAYARKFGLSDVYTPEAVVGGKSELLGSDEPHLLAAIRTASAQPGADVALTLEPGDSTVLASADIALPTALSGRKLELLFAVYEMGLVTPVKKGENGGSVLRNDFVVRSLERAGKISSSASSERIHKSVKLGLSKDWKKSELGVAVFVQDPTALEIVGADAKRLADVSPRR